MSGVLSALEEAHALAIVHRGVTPEHLVLASYDRLKLGGFGLAKPVTDLKLTCAGAVLGDPRYIAPEQISGAHTVDARADQYSCAIVLYEMISGHPPFHAGSDYDIMLGQLSTQPDPLSRRIENVPAELDQVLSTALAKDPSKRFSDVQQFRLAIERLLASFEASPEPVREKPPARKKGSLQRAGKSRMSVLFGVLSFTAGFAGAVSVLLRR
jgi:serine/threonine protein kinase